MCRLVGLVGGRVGIGGRRVDHVRSEVLVLSYAVAAAATARRAGAAAAAALARVGKLCDGSSLGEASCQMLRERASGKAKPP